MSFATDLLEQAGYLIERERTRPKQISLRRAISSAYYSLFHLLIDDAAAYLVGNKLAPAVMRSFEHQALRAACVTMTDVARKPNQNIWLRAHTEQVLDPDLIGVCEAFVELQDSRHRADYDKSASFSRRDAEAAVGLSLAAQQRWAPQRATHNGRVLLLASAKLLRPQR